MRLDDATLCGLCEPLLIIGLFQQARPIAKSRNRAASSVYVRTNFSCSERLTGLGERSGMQGNMPRMIQFSVSPSANVGPARTLPLASISDLALSTTASI